MKEKPHTSLMLISVALFCKKKKNEPESHIHVFYVYFSLQKIWSKF